MTFDFLNFFLCIWLYEKKNTLDKGKKFGSYCACKKNLECMNTPRSLNAFSFMLNSSLFIMVIISDYDV